MFQASLTVFLILGVTINPVLGMGQSAPTLPQSGRQALELLTLDEELQAISSRVAPSVVKIGVVGLVAVAGSDNNTSNVITKQQAVGSGMIIDPSGFILTNAHVVEHATNVSVDIVSGARNADGLPMGLRHLPARIIGKDLLTDIALLKVEATGLPALRLAKSDSVHVGQLAIAVGSPLGLENTVTLGIVSAMHRQFNPSSPVSYLQTDASINPGNSGGPLIDIHGEVIGMNTMIASESGGNEGVGFSIPSDILDFVYQQLRARGHVRRGAIGVVARAIDPGLAAGLHLPKDTGIILEDVVPGSSAEQAGLQPGDVITAVDGTAMTDPRPLSALLFRKQIGETVSFDLQRDQNTTLNIPVKVMRRPRDAENLLDPEHLGGDIITKLGVVAVPIDANIAKLIPPVRKSGGLLVVGLTAGGNAASVGLQMGDVLYSLNQIPLDSIGTLRDAISQLSLNAAVVLQIERESSLEYVEFTNSE